MIDQILSVKDMPLDVREACLERGHKDTDEMTIKDAMCEWSAWEIGDKSWGSNAAEYVAAMATRNSIL